MTAFGNAPSDADPFWSVIHRRHPDIDIVLVPEDDPRPDPPEDDPSLIGTVPAAFDAWLSGLWKDVVPSIEAPSGGSRWMPSPSAGCLSRTATLAVTGIDAVTAAQLLSAVDRLLSDAGWHVFVPEDGMSRVLASNGDRMRREVQAVHVEDTGRFALLGTWSPVAVGARAAAAAFGATS